MRERHAWRVVEKKLRTNSPNTFSTTTMAQDVFFDWIIKKDDQEVCKISGKPVSVHLTREQILSAQTALEPGRLVFSIQEEDGGELVRRIPFQIDVAEGYKLLPSPALVQPKEVKSALPSTLFGFDVPVGATPKKRGRPPGSTNKVKEEKKRAREEPVTDAAEPLDVSSSEEAPSKKQRSA